MRHAILNKFYYPTLFFFLLPLFQMSLGLIFSLPYQSLNVLSFMVLYAFILLNQMLENILLRIPNSDFRFSKRFFGIVQALNIVTILYFGFRYSWLAGLVLLLVSFLLQTQFLFSYYNLETLAAILIVLLKTVFLNAFSFYIGAGFIPLRFIPYFLGLTLPFFLYEIARVRPEIKKRSLAILLVLTYGLGVALLWQHIGAWSLLLLLSSPFAWGLLNDNFNRKSTSVFAINYALFFVLLVMVAVLPL